MRISVVSYSCRKIGGTEQNLDVVLPELARRGHATQFVYFHDEPETRERVAAGAGIERIDAARTGQARTLARVADFRPDLINVHGEIHPAFQARLLEIAPAAYSVHNYYGSCISGLKTHVFPVIQPCTRTFGPACLLQYFPRRCGGRNPITMARRYATERKRLRVMAGYDAVITHSRHMEAEYERHGLEPERIHGLPYEVTARNAGSAVPYKRMGERARLLFVGRMEKLKGGHVLIDALPRIAAALRLPVELHLAGDGPARERWQQQAAHVMRQDPAVSVHFPGWVTGQALQNLYLESHLLVVPSLWPEPFGKVGCEAGAYGLPVAAFAVGGIEEWLTPGVNGMLAPGDPPCASGLAAAVTRCLSDSAVYARLCEGALANVQRFNLHVHVDSLIALFEKICRERKDAAL